MSEKTADYTATPIEALQGGLATLKAAGPTLRVRLHFAVMSRGNVQPEVTIEVDNIPADGPVPDGTLADIGMIAAKALRIASGLGKRWEWHYAHVAPLTPDDDAARADKAVWERVSAMAMNVSNREEIEGWLVERQP